MAEPTEIDESLNPGVAGSVGEVLRPGTVLFLKGLIRAHGVDKIIGHADAGHRGPYRFGIENVSFDDLEPGKRLRSESFRTPRQASHCVARVQEPFQQLSTNLPRGASNQNKGFHAAFSPGWPNSASI